MPILRNALQGLMFAFVLSLFCRQITCTSFSIIAAAAEPEESSEKQEEDARKERYSKWMRKYSEGTKIKLLNANEQPSDEAQLAELVPNPVFRYTDETQGIPDATLWVWTRDARPVAFQKVEGNNHGGGQAWTVCFTSLSEGLISVNWPIGNSFQSRAPGVKFNQIPDAPVPADIPRGRIAQIKTLKERFSGRVSVNPDGTGGAESRIMPKPIFEYVDPATKLPTGAIFAVTSTGTNPDFLLLIEARPTGDGKLRWEYAHARMTANSVRFRLDDSEVWSEPGDPPRVSENWTFFFLRRDFK